MGMKVGYARVSTSAQNLDIQLERLSDCDRNYQEKVSAASTRNRPKLKNALDFVREEDVFVVTKLDRLARSVVDLSNVVQRLEDKKVDFRGCRPRDRHDHNLWKATVQHPGGNW